VGGGGGGGHCLYFPVRYLEMVSISSVGVYVIFVFLCYPLVVSTFLEKIGHYGARAFSFEKACFVVGSFA